MTVKLLTEHAFGISKLKRRLHRLVRVYTCQNATLLEITYRCSNSYMCLLDMYNETYQARCINLSNSVEKMFEFIYKGLNEE